MSKKQKTIEERIEDILEDCVEWYERPGQPGVGDESFNYDRAIKKLKFLISDIVREIVGKEPKEKEIPTGQLGIGWLIRDKEIREKARKLGLNI